MDQKTQTPATFPSNLDARAIEHLAAQVCASHVLSAPQLSDAGLSTSCPLPAATLGEILRQASFIAEQRRYPPRRFVIRDLQIESGDIHGFHIPQGVEFDGCVFSSPNDSSGAFRLYDFSVASIHVEDCFLTRKTGFLIEDGAISGDLSMSGCVGRGAIQIEDVRIGHDFVLDRLNEFSGEEATPHEDDPAAEDQSSLVGAKALDLRVKLVRVGGHVRIGNCVLKEVVFDRCHVGGRIKLVETTRARSLLFREVEALGDIDISSKADTRLETRTISLDDVETGGALTIGEGADESEPNVWIKLRDRLELNQVRCRFGLSVHRVRLSSDFGKIAFNRVRVRENAACGNLYAAEGVELSDVEIGGHLQIQTTPLVIGDLEREAEAQDMRSASLASFKLVTKESCTIGGALRIRFLDNTALLRDSIKGGFWPGREAGEVPDHGGADAALSPILIKLPGLSASDVEIVGRTSGEDEIARNGENTPDLKWHPVEIDFASANLSGSLTFSETPPALSRLSLRNSVIAGAVDFSHTRWLRAPVDAEGKPPINLAGARIGVLDDTALIARGGQPDEIDISGMRFNGLTAQAAAVSSREGWLKDHARVKDAVGEHSVDAPIWLRHADALEAQGQREQANDLHQALRRTRRLKMPWGLKRGLDSFLDCTARYGFNHLRTVYVFGGAWACFALFWFLVWAMHGQQGASIDEKAAFMPTALSNYTEMKGGEPQPIARGYPPFNPVLYALDLMIPVADLGMKSHWSPNLRWDPHGDGAANADFRAGASWSGLVLQFVKILNIGSGFALLALWATALTGLLRRGEGEK